MHQTDLFEYIYDKFKIDKPIRLIELFAGVGSQAMALRDIGAKFEHWKVVEFDKFAINSYNSIHDTNFNVTDIRDVHCNDLEIVEKDKYCYIMTYSFPCQDLSKAGKQKGMSKGSGTRSGLLWEVERILLEAKENGNLPQVLLMENVPDVIGKKNYDDFMKWYAALENMGYQSYYKVLNAKDYGIPQNRERCFMVSILGKFNYQFSKKIPLKLRLKDMLEEQVDDKYYLSDKMVNCFMSKGTGKYPRRERFIQSLKKVNEEGIANTIITTEGSKSSCNFIIVKEATKKGYAEAKIGDSINLDQPNSKTRRGRVGKGVAQTLTTSCNQAVVVENDLIRKLTPLECWRLMGFKDRDFEKAENVNSNCQLYKQAGNSIVKNVLMAIFREMMEGY